MPEVIRQQLTEHDISSLGQKLDQLGNNLTDKERQILFAVFRLALQAVSEHGPNQAAANPGATPVSVGQLPSVSSGFADIFRPGLGAGVQGAEEVMSGQIQVQVPIIR